MLCCRRHFEDNTMEKVQIVEDEFGLTKQPSTQETEQVKRFTFTNRNGVSVQASRIHIIINAVFRRTIVYTYEHSHYVE